MVVHPRENDLVLGTHGRGFWVLDDLGLLEELTPAVVAGHSHLATPRTATQIRDVNRGRGSVGDNYWTARNPPRGAVLDYWIGDAAAGEPVVLEILDEEGSVVRRVEDSTAVRGVHRIVWDLRHEAPIGADGQPSRRLPGRFVLPGSYQVRLTVGEQVHVRPLQVRMDPGLSMADGARRDLDATLALQADLVGAVALSGSAVDTVLAQAGTVLESLAGLPDAPDTLTERALALEAGARHLQVVLEGPGQQGIAQQETVLPLSTLVTRLYSTTEGWSGGPTADQSRLTERAHGEVAELLAALRPLLDRELPELRRAMTEAGIPWPAGDAPVLPAGLLPPFVP
jgi:hypothetical protein